MSLAIRNDVIKEEKKDFEFECIELTNLITTRLHAHAQLLRSCSAFFDISDTVSRIAWHDAYQRQRLDKNLPGIQGLGYALIIRPNDLSKHETTIRKEGFPSYSVYPQGKRDIYTSIIYLEPFRDRNLRAFGFDMFSEPNRRAAMCEARDYDIAALTKRIRLVQETDTAVQAGTLLYVPVYKKNMPIQTVQERRRAIKGWVYSPYRMDDLMFGILGGHEGDDDKQIHFWVFDDESNSEQSLLYKCENGKSNKGILDGFFVNKTTINFNGYFWYLVFTQYSQNSTNINYSKVWLSAVGGVGVSLFLFLFYISLLATNMRAELLAEELTQDLRDSEEKYRKLFNSEIYAVFILDDEKRKLIDANKAFFELYNYSEDDIISGIFLESITCDQATTEKYIQVAKHQGGVFVPLTYNKKKDGTVFPVELAGSASEWRKKKVLMLQVLDITERLHAEKEVKDLALRNQTLLQTASDGIHVVDEQGNIVEANEAFAKMLGYSREELLSMNVSEFDMQWDPNQIKSNIKKFMATPTLFETKHKKKNGDIIDVEINSVGVDLNGHKSLYAASRDITDRKIAEEKLKENE